MIRPLAACGFALIAFAVLTAAPPAKPQAAKSAFTVQELVFFTVDGPVRVRMAVTLGGKATDQPWRAALDSLFAHCDKNRNGSLEANERQMFQNGRPGGLNQFIIVDGIGYNAPQMPPVAFVEKNGKVDADAFRTGFATASLGPVSVTQSPPRADSQSLTDALFKRLDTDGDGKLSLAELKAARLRLAGMDVDEDELLTADELLGRFQNQGVYAFQALELDGFNGRRPAVQITDLLIGPAGQPLTAKELLAARDKNQDGALTAEELGCDPKVIADLDADGDGRLDTDELAAWLRRGPDLDLAFDLTDPTAGEGWLPAFVNRPAPADSTVKQIGKGRLANQAKAGPDGGIGLDLRDARFRFSVDTGTANNARQQWKNSADQLRQAFDMLAGKKGELDKQKVLSNPETAAVGPLFDFADRDGNGKLTRAELDQALRTGEALVNCRVGITVADRGRGLFELLDRDGDGRLSPRELNAAAELLAMLDRDGDGKLARTELPRGYAITAQPASVDVLPNYGGLGGEDIVFINGYGGGPVRSTPAALDVPEWFRSMDRNGDGDVSAREFAGPPALFKKIDTDGDGLISPEEARAFEKTKGK